MPIKHSTPEDFVADPAMDPFPVVSEVVVAEVFPLDEELFPLEEETVVATPSRRNKLIAIGAGAGLLLLVAGVIVWRIRAR